MNSELSRALRRIQTMVQQEGEPEIHALCQGSGLEEPLFYEAIGWLVKERKLLVRGDRIRWRGLG